MMQDCSAIEVSLGNVAASVCRTFKHFMGVLGDDILSLLHFLQERNAASKYVAASVQEHKEELVIVVEEEKVVDLHQTMNDLMRQNNLVSQSAVIEFLILGCGIEWKGDSTMKIFSKQNDKILEKLNKYRKETLFCDMDVFIGDDSRHTVHRCVLAATSQYFMDVFQTNTSFIRIDNITQKEIFEDVLEFAYTGVITINEENHTPLSKMAECLQISSLQKICEDYFKLTPSIQNKKNLQSADAAAENGIQLFEENSGGSGLKTYIIHGDYPASDELALEESEGQAVDDHFGDNHIDDNEQSPADLLFDAHDENQHGSLVDSDANEIQDDIQTEKSILLEDCHQETASKQTDLVKIKKKVMVRKLDSVTRRFCCGTCRSWFRTRSHLKRHMISHTGERKHCCTTCGKLFLKADHLTRHESTHSSERPFPCDKCDKKFKNKHNLQRHQQSHSSERPFFCELCAKQFKDRSGLLIHQKSHDESERVCPFCGKCFKQRNRLEYHISRHENPPSCTVCGKNFTFETQLRKHMMSHSGVRPFNCETCGKQFSNAHGMKLHQKKHTGIGLYSCTRCDRKFLDNYHLQRHVKTHTGEKPYKCDVCDRSFSRIDNCVNHKRSCEVKLAMRRNMQSFTESKGEEMKIKRVKQIRPLSANKQKGETGDTRHKAETVDIAIAVRADEIASSRYRKIAKRMPDLSLVILKSNPTPAACQGPSAAITNMPAILASNTSQETDIAFGVRRLGEAETCQWTQGFSESHV